MWPMDRYLATSLTLPPTMSNPPLIPGDPTLKGLSNLHSLSYPICLFCFFFCLQPGSTTIQLASCSQVGLFGAVRNPSSSPDTQDLWWLPSTLGTMFRLLGLTPRPSVIQLSLYLYLSVFPFKLWSCVTPILTQFICFPLKSFTVHFTSCSSYLSNHSPHTLPVVLLPSATVLKKFLESAIKGKFRHWYCGIAG